jgi:hypothetical protein
MEMSHSESADLHMATKLNGHLGPNSHMGTFNKDAMTLGLNAKLKEYTRASIIKRS